MFNKILLWFYSFFKVFGKTIVYIWAGLSFITVLMMIIFGPDPVGECADDGGWWDEKIDICRFDHPNETDEELEEYVTGYCQGDGKGLYRCKRATVELLNRKQWRKMKGLE